VAKPSKRDKNYQWNTVKAKNKLIRKQSHARLMQVAALCVWYACLLSPESYGVTFDRKSSALYCNGRVLPSLRCPIKVTQCLETFYNTKRINLQTPEQQLTNKFVVAAFKVRNMHCGNIRYNLLLMKQILYKNCYITGWNNCLFRKVKIVL
jgi:hypothetical protein